MKKPIIYIVNSSTFGKHFDEHLTKLESFSTLRHLNVPADINEDELGEKLADANGIIASVTPKFSRATLAYCKNLVLLTRHGIGCDNVDLEAAKEFGILVSRVKGFVEKEAVAEYAVALTLAAGRKVFQGAHAVKSNNWSARATMIGLELKGKTIGIIGMGNIGSRSAEIFSKGFGAQVIACDPYIEKSKFAEFNAREVSLQELISLSDVILFHCPLTAETRRMFKVAEFDQMRADLILVNTCRGELLDEDALYNALKAQKICAYATDVIEGEPIGTDHRLTKLDNVLITPHLGGYSWESLKGMGLTCVEDMIAVFFNNALPGELANPSIVENGYRIWQWY
ncbi:NAD(P)-dependent oxidoreductase [Pedobacter aquatilis]|uniref:NAD(P)-dependent oxidoreductase n=1 Tax=Pedobacter aquatilis TaxID=351343 RepID=UPI00292F2E2A|nr:NAD(P)-dependent oxidoreductase [Pedobacter aquatilis]